MTGVQTCALPILEQYRKGERFIAGLASLGGDAALHRLWEGPERLPDEDELADPGRWIRHHVEEASR